MPPTSQRPLGTLLVEMGFVDPGQLEAALAEQQRSSKRLGKLLIEAGLITEDRLVHALSHQLGIEACDPIMTPVHEAVLAMIPPKVAFEHRILPVARQREGDHEVLYVATADPLDQRSGEAVRRAVAAGTQVRWMLAGETEMDLALARHYGVAPNAAEKKADTAPQVRVIAGTPVAPPRRPDERSMVPLHSTGDIFAALQEAVDLSGEAARTPPGDYAPAVTGDWPAVEAPPDDERTAIDPMPPAPSEERPAPSTASRDFEFFPNAPPGTSQLPDLGPEPSHPSLDLPRLQGTLQDEISDEILVAEEVIESGDHLAPSSVPAFEVVADLSGVTEEVAPAEDPDPFVPPDDAPVVPAGPSWADMLGADDEPSRDLPGPELMLAEAEAAVLPAATASMAEVIVEELAEAPASSADLPPPEVPPMAPPTELDLGGALDDSPFGSPDSFEELAPAPEPEALIEAEASHAALEEIAAEEPFSLEAEVEPELGLDGLPLDAPPPELTADTAPEPPVDVPSEPFFEATVETAAQAPVEPVLEVPAELPAVQRARDLLGGYVAGGELEHAELQWVLRLVAAALLRGALQDDDFLGAVLDEVGPPPI